MSIDFTYLRQPPKRYTFEMPKLADWVRKNVYGENVLNLFAGKTKIFENGICETRIDLNEEMPADYHMDAFDFVIMAKENKWIYDTIIFDPPYNLRKAVEKYNGIYTTRIRLICNELPNILKLGGKVISFGYSSIGMSRKRGFELISICLICHSGRHDDTICIVERKIQDLLKLN